MYRVVLRGIAGDEYVLYGGVDLDLANTVYEESVRVYGDAEVLLLKDGEVVE